MLQNNSEWYIRRQLPARHRACPQRLKYIHDAKDGYIPYVEDADCAKQSIYADMIRKNTSFDEPENNNDWNQELMGLAQQVQSSLLSLDDFRRTPRLTQSRTKPSPIPSVADRYEQLERRSASKRLLSRRASLVGPRPHTTKPNVIPDKPFEELNTKKENQDSGIWLLPILCHVLHVDNLSEAQNWLVNSKESEKRLATELISRTMYDLQNGETSFPTDVSATRTLVVPSNLNNVYWPCKIWQHQQKSKLSTDYNETCERATSPVRILTPARYIPTPTPTLLNQRVSDPMPEIILPRQSVEPRILSSRSQLTTPMTPNLFDRQSRRSFRVMTCKSVSTEDDNINKPTSAKPPLI